MTIKGAVLALCMLLAGCGGGSGASSSPLGASGATSSPPSSGATTPSPSPGTGAKPSSGWRLTVYYTPVLSYYSGPPQVVTGCPTLQCSNGTANLGSYPSDFVAQVHEEGTGRIAQNRYLNWSANVGYWLDTLPRDAQGTALMPYRSAAGDPGIPFGTILKIQSCGSDTTTGTPTDPTVCASYTRPSWEVRDRFTAGAVGQHVDLYIGEQTSATFTSGRNYIDASSAAIVTSPPVPSAAIAKAGPSDSFQWILNAPLDTSAAASIYDIDAFTSSAADVSTLHGQKRLAVCYVNAGAYENFRPDSSSFPAQVVGKDYTGWPGEKWLDIRRIDLLGPIMQARLDMCKAKGFDAVEPDNIDGFENATGFPLGADDQIVYNTWLASMAHERGMSIALKNDQNQVAELLPLFDFALAEDCWQQGWCSQLTPFHAAGRAVFTVEYTDVTSAATFTGTYCARARAAGFYAVLKNRQLDSWLQTCP